MKTTTSNESLCASRKSEREFSIGDRVCFAREWLRGTGQHTGVVPHAKGTIKATESNNGITLARVDWGRYAEDVPFKEVLITDLVHEDDVKFEEGHACCLCGSVLNEDGFGQPEWLSRGSVFTLKHEGIAYAAFASSIEQARAMTEIAIDAQDENLPVVKVDEQLIGTLRKLSSDDKQAVAEASVEIAKKLRRLKVSDENPFEEERDPCDPYEIWLKRDGKKLYVLKKYQKACMEPPDLTICPACLPDLITGMNPNAKWLVYDPDTDEKHDMFVRDVIFNAVKIKDFPFQREHPIASAIIKAVKAYNDRGANSARVTVRLLDGEYSLFLGDNPVMNGSADEIMAKIEELSRALLPDFDSAKSAQMDNQALLARRNESAGDKALLEIMLGKVTEAGIDCCHGHMKLDYRNGKRGPEYRYTCTECSVSLSEWHTSQEKARQDVNDRNYDAQRAKNPSASSVIDESDEPEKVRTKVDMDTKTAVIPPGYGYWEVDKDNFRRATEPIHVERVQLFNGKYYGYVGTKQIRFTV